MEAVLGRVCFVSTEFSSSFFFLFYITQRAISITRLMDPPLHLFIPRDIEGKPS